MMKALRATAVSALEDKGSYGGLETEERNGHMHT